MIRRLTTTNTNDAHDHRKELLKTAAGHPAGRHRGSHAPAAGEAQRLPAAAPVHRPRRPRPTQPKM
ncbi:MAG: hypothetical protein U5L03_17650 [Burkholderiaceae bacterium]|nr:hypothetical protein [Burkholderiaceae bacterium]